MNKNSAPAKKQAFTLIELLISLGILSLVLSSTFLLLGTQIKNYHKVKSRLEEKQLSLRIINLISKDLKNTEKITSLSQEEIELCVKGQPLSYGIKDQRIKRKSGQQTAYLTNNNEILTFECKTLNQKLISLKIGNLQQNVYLRNIL